MIIVACVLAVSLIIVVALFIWFLLKLTEDFRVREWELQERIREPNVEVMPPPMVDAEAKVKRDMADNIEDMQFVEEPDEAEMGLVGEIYPEGVPGREDR